MSDNVRGTREDFKDAVVGYMGDSGTDLLSEACILYSSGDEDNGTDFMEWLSGSRPEMYGLIDDPSLNTKICDVIADIEGSYSVGVLINLLADYAEYKPSFRDLVLDNKRYYDTYGDGFWDLGEDTEFEDDEFEDDEFENDEFEE